LKSLDTLALVASDCGGVTFTFAIEDPRAADANEKSLHGPVYSKDVVEVEFVTASGRTQALVTLAISSIRPVSPKDILAVRQLDAARAGWCTHP